jgi:hypothetical protein
MLRITVEHDAAEGAPMVHMSEEGRRVMIHAGAAVPARSGPPMSPGGSAVRDGGIASAAARRAVGATGQGPASARQTRVPGGQGAGDTRVHDAGAAPRWFQAMIDRASAQRKED